MVVKEGWGSVSFAPGAPRWEMPGLLRFEDGAGGSPGALPRALTSRDATFSGVFVIKRERKLADADLLMLPLFMSSAPAARNLPYHTLVCDSSCPRRYLRLRVACAGSG